MRELILLLNESSNHADSSLSTMSSSLPTTPDTSHSQPRSSHTSIALISASLFSFLLFVFLSVHKRPSRRAQAAPSPPVTNKKASSKHRPHLWEVCLDEDDHTRLDGAVHNWQPISAWASTTRLRRRSPPRSRQSSAPHALPQTLPEPVAQAWFHTASRPPPAVPDHRTLNIALLVAMPSRQPPAQPMHGIAAHHPIGSRLSYGEGQLSIGTTSLPLSRHVVLPAALADYELDQRR
ncbi:hypothetical protein EI94DRAFT_1722663 [Lactarius quietus]|nr:hypothetical protein EI94DRAFT_1722663 [Lactarius quietus]